MEDSFRDTYRQYLKDESRTVGYADSISFPRTEEEVSEDLKTHCGKGIPVTVQGARTGLTGGCVPFGGHILNTSGLDRFLGMEMAEDGSFLIRVQPAVPLSRLRSLLAEKSLPTEGWSEESLAVYEQFRMAPEQFFPPDPTESSAFLGGIAACNASGSRSYLYGPMRPYVMGLRLALTDGDILVLRRGECFAEGRSLSVTTVNGRTIQAQLPSYRMPSCKNASGYYAADDMDAIDLIVGSDGTLGVLTELTLKLIPKPKVIWAVSVFFKDEPMAIRFTEALRPEIKNAAAIEYFDGNALQILRNQRRTTLPFLPFP
ncbi:MAG: FAD-binding oxidoreductase [Stomatobaculum sp.]|nr:FAD-binding oxidoreductase [Stomatobaculum sp.]